MGTVGLWELRQDAPGLVRRVEAGEQITITVTGRPAARLVPAAPTPWRPWEAMSALFDGPPDPDWRADRCLLDDGVRDPWDRA